MVTVIETLSPTNKESGPDRLQYLIKRRELLHSQANFVEIDLLRGGSHMPSDDFPECDYCVLVSRAIDRPQAGVWPWRLRDTMPKVPIPIVRDIPEIALNLKVVLDLVYDRGAYQNYLFDEPPEPLLAPDDAAWAAQFVPTPTL